MRELDDYLKAYPQELAHDDDVRCGAQIEAEMKDGESGATEWIRGQVEKRKKSSFSVRFTVNNDLERGEWVEEYSMNALGIEWRWPILCKQDFEQHLNSARESCQQVRTLMGQLSCHTPLTRNYFVRPWVGR
jgi:hypothetical protein